MTKAHELRLAKRMARLGTETAFEVLVKARALEAKGRDMSISPAWLLRSATRERNSANYRDRIMGFRVAKTLSPDAQASQRPEVF